MKFFMMTFLFTILTLNNAAYAQMTSCDMAKLMENELVKLNQERDVHRSLQDQYLQARRIQEQLADPESSVEILRLAERFEEEVAGLEEGRDWKYKIGSVSIGAIIISGYFINEVRLSTKGKPFKQRMRLNFKGPINLLTNSVFFASTLSSLWMVYSIQKSQTKIEMLAEVINKLNKLTDLSSKIEKLGDDIMEIRASYDLLVDDLVFQGLASVGQNGLLRCD